MANERSAGCGFCNVLAQEKGLDPVGTAGHFEDVIVIETRLPWKRDIYSQPGALPPEMIDLRAQWQKQYQEGRGYPHRSLLVAPDADYSREGFRRVMFYSRQPGMIAQFDKIEYLVPESDIGALVWALYEAREQLPAFEQYRQPDDDSTRDLLVCTHGTIDSACGKFGYPLFNLLRRQYAHDDLRVWRVSHFGGHVFAPTLMEMPTGHLWAYIEGEQAAQIAGRGGDVAALRGHYRGWAGVAAGFVQAAEYELWQRFGWAWFDYAKSGAVLAQDSGDAPRWADIRIDYVSPDGSDQGAYEARVEVRQFIQTIFSTGSNATHNYPQYAVTAVRKLVAEAGYAPA